MSDPPITIGERVIQPAAPARTRGGQWWLDLPLGRKGALLTIAPWAVTVVVLVSTFALQRHADDIRDDLRIGTTTLVDASLLTEDVGEAEGAVRGYAATGDATMLAPYDAVADRVPDAIAELADESPPQYADDVATLGDDATAAIAALGTARDAIAPGAADPSAAAAALAPATAAVDDFRGTSDGLRVALYAGLTDQADESVRVQDQAQRVLIVGLLLVIATTLAGGAILARSLIGRTVRLSENVKRYSTGDRILPTVAARDEIGQLAEALAGAGNTLSRNQRELTASRDAALAATRAKDVFLSRTSHELRTPLSAIIGFGQLLQMEDLSHDDRESVDHIVSAGRHLLSLIDDVLDIAKIETGAVSMSVEPVVVADVVDEAVALVRAQATEREITLSVAVPPRLAVRADRQRLEQVVLNLLTNAVKYNAHGGRIDVAVTTIVPAAGGAPAGGVPVDGAAVGAPTVAAPVGGAPAGGAPATGVPVGGAAASGASDGGGPDGAAPLAPRSSAGHGRGRSRVRLSVADTGTGIAPDQIERLFEPFERLDAAARGIDGTGVGLALSKALVEAMGGTVGMTSTVGEGSTFWCDLDLAVPAEPAVPAPTTSAVGPDEAVADAGGVVLYVEDNEANQRLVERVLRDRPERLEVVAEGGQGLDAARRLRPGVVLLDLDLPDMQGREVLSRLKADAVTAGIPVVVVSADATRRSRDELVRAGAHRYLTKPVDVHELMAVLDGLADDGRPGAGHGARPATARIGDRSDG